MPLRRTLPWLVVTLLLALIAMALSAGAVRKTDSAIAAAIFATVMILTGIRGNAPLWLRNPQPQSLGVTPRTAAFETSRLIGITYFWCALAFFTIYLGTSVRWQHGWQYGSAMLLIAVGHAFYLARLADPADSASEPAAVNRLVKLAGYQAIAIAVGLIWLIGSGKLSTLKGDWAANQIFLAGGFAVMCLSMIMMRTHSVLSGQAGA